MFALPIRFFAPIALVSGLLLTACGGGGGSDDDDTPAPVAATLEVIKIGNGSGTVSGSGVDCGSTCTATSTVGASVTLIATPGSGQMFDGWTGDASTCGTDSSCALTLNSTRVVARASFSVIPTTTVTAVLAGNSMGTVTSSPAGINCSAAAGSDCTETFRQGGMVTLTAAETAPNNTFVRWSGDAAGCGFNRGCTLMLTGNNINAIATFQPINRALSVSKSGSGTVTSSPVGISCGADCAENYQQGSMISLTAAPDNGFSFQGWGGDCTGTGSCVVTMDGDKAVSATFVSTNVTLTVNKLGNGTGTVTSDPAGISCGSACSASYTRNASVSLSAVATANSVFDGWSGGGCSGTGSCTPTLNDNVTITASFSNAAGQTAGELYGLTANNRIVSFDRSAPGTFRTAATITGVNGESVVAIDSRPFDEKVYALTSTGKLYTVDIVSGAATLRSTLVADPSDGTDPFIGLSGTRFGMDFNPVVDRLRVLSDTGQNLRINTDNGQVTTDTALSRADGTPAAADGAYTFNYATPSATSLFVVDSGNDTLYLQSPPNDGTLTAIGTLGVDFASKAGFEIIGTNVDAFVAGVVAGGSAQGALYSIDLRSGVTTKAGDFDGNDPLISLTARIVAGQSGVLGDLAMLTATGKLITANRATAASTSTSYFLTGVPSTERMLDIDFRTSDRALYLLTRTEANVGKLYQIDLATAAARLISTITGSGSTLTGNVVKMDFVPTTAASAGSETVQIVSDTGLNLTVVAATGAPTSSSAPGPGTPVLGGIAYTNAFLRTNRSTAYVLDTNTRRLLTLNGSTLTAIGDLRLDSVSANIGFDISGSTNEGLLISTEGQTSKLYSVNLSTGAASAPITLPGDVVIGAAIKPFGEPENYAVVQAVGGNSCTTALSPCFIRFNSTPNVYTVLNRAPFTLGTGVTLIGMDFRPANGSLVALGSNSSLYTVDLASGATSLLSTLVADPNDSSNAFSTPMINTTANNRYSVDFEPATDRLRVSGGTGNVNLLINVDTGSTITDPDIKRPEFAVTGIAYDNFTGSPTLYGIDSRTQRLFTISTSAPDNGVLSLVGNLGVQVSNTNGLEILPNANPAAAAVARFVSTDVDSVVKLYSLNLSTGAATLVGPILGSNVAITGFRGLAASSSSDMFGITTDNQLTSFNRDTGVVVTNPQTIAGIPPTETILGMDYNSANTATAATRLYVVTRDAARVGKVYTLDPSTRVATQVPAGSMTLNGMPYVLAGDSFGVDINAGAGTLRIVSDTKVNIDVSISTLAVTAQPNLFEDPPTISAGAYSSNSVGSPVSRLLQVDTANNNLMQQLTTTNLGALVDVRPLGISVNRTGGAFGGMDIVGGEDGYGVAAFRVGGTAAEDYSRLYRINLLPSGTGNAFTSMGSVGVSDDADPTVLSPTSVQVNALATRLQP